MASVNAELSGQYKPNRFTNTMEFLVLSVFNFVVPLLLNCNFLITTPFNFCQSISFLSVYFHSVLRWVLTLKISNSGIKHVFDSRIYVRITWYTLFLPV